MTDQSLYIAGCLLFLASALSNVATVLVLLKGRRKNP